jgi:hypothetical protein
VLVGYWNFDDGTSDDKSPKGNHGVFKGDAKILKTIMGQVIDVGGTVESLTK